jgi:protein required for attachment to host cells
LKLWVLIADGERARIVTPEAHHGRYRTELDLGTSEHPHYPPYVRQDPHHLDRQPFAVRLAAVLSDAAEAGHFEQLVLCGPGSVVHAVHEALSRQAAAMLAGTLSRDLTKVPDHELTDHLAQWWMGLPKET